MASRIVLHLRSVANSPGGSNASATHGQSNTSPKFRNLFKSDVAELPDAPLRSGVRRIDGGMEAAYADVIVTVEADTNMEKRLEAAADAEDEEMEHREEWVGLALKRAALEEVLSSGRTYLTGSAFSLLHVNLTKLEAACFAIYVWDFILTFPAEYKTMWKAQRWTPVRVAFFFNRYLSL
ncbi:hypothetical protein BT69DRAFT_1358048 [Atractiella rhizophila]|nr:hypothetical protein BT69DRAFT_1358048 [Atractiella rhizophila]